LAKIGKLIILLLKFTVEEEKEFLKKLTIHAIKYV